MEQSEPTRPGFGGFSVDHKATAPFARAVGAFLVNFGALDLSARVWLHAMSSDQLLVSQLDSLRLRQRIDLIRFLAKSGRMPTTLSARVDTLWARAAELTSMRNQVAHNPVVFGWNGREEVGPPDHIGILDRRKGAKAPITLAEINAATDNTAEVVQKLHEIALELESVPGWPPDK